MGLGDRLHRLGLRAGLEVRRLERANSPAARRRRLIGDLGVDLVIDAGANRGQYGLDLRAAGYDGRIVSFEPVAAARAELERAGAGDSSWEVRPEALGAKSGDSEINVAGNRAASSSLLDPTGRHTAAAPGAAPVAKEAVELTTLDAVAEGLLGDAHAPLLKLDIQGYELEALRGAAATLPRIAAVEAELSLVELYEGAPLLPEVFEYLRSAGFECVAITPGFTDYDAGRMLQVDGLFARA